MVLFTSSQLSANYSLPQGTWGREGEDKRRCAVQGRRTPPSAAPVTAAAWAAPKEPSTLSAPYGCPATHPAQCGGGPCGHGQWTVAELVTGGLAVPQGAAPEDVTSVPWSSLTFALAHSRAGLDTAPSSPSCCSFMNCRRQTRGFTPRSSSAHNPPPVTKHRADIYHHERSSRRGFQDRVLNCRVSISYTA